MVSLVYKEEKYKKDDIILLKNQQKRIQQFKILKIQKKPQFYLLELKYNDLDYDKCTVIKFDTKKKKFIKKYKQNDKSVEIDCRKMRKNEDVYIFDCDFCEISHKHSRLGQNDCKCSSSYSPYYDNGYILKLDYLNFTNFNDYLLYNYNLLLQKYINYSTIYWYVRYIKQFYSGSLCNNYGVSVFPYINNNTLEIIKKKYNNEPKFKNLLTTLKKFISIMSSNKLPYYMEKFQDDINKLYIYYNNPNKQQSKEDSEEESDESEEEEIVIPEISNINMIKLDIEDCLLEHVNKSKTKTIKYYIMNYPNEKKIYYKTEDRKNQRLWITIEYYEDYIWGVSETNIDSIDFMNYKLNLIENENQNIINYDSD